ncbi:uncharacterized protein LOC108736644 [Agrilus planipennis]|uniref:Uncharacterized protein LOC108736644 n=1 Tax=Agrilus planipennis TaxID=224129 RepID=A0A1W4WVV8_AGRPL|nr:uncharacterized protein LOC108736644 [Agrilus planipennis]XP_018324643.1 uncharacterized protein LOC108736644 [Agrilus planipennis]
MSDWSDSSPYQTTYSEEERIEEYLKKRKERRIKEYNEIEENRKTLFQTYYEAEIRKADSLFNQPGIAFIRFNHKKIKFSFTPCEVVDYVSCRVIFYVSLRYRNNHWLILRDTIPANYKMPVYKKFYKGNSFRSDDDIMKGIMYIYILLMEWAKEHSNFRLEKFKRYKSGEDVFLDSDDEEIFLSQEEISELHAKREAVLKRMVAPSPKKPKGGYFLR